MEISFFNRKKESVFLTISISAVRKIHKKNIGGSTRVWFQGKLFSDIQILKQLLTNNSKIISEARSLRIPEVDPAAVDALIPPLDVPHEQRGGRGGGGEVRARPEHLRR